MFGTSYSDDKYVSRISAILYILQFEKSGIKLKPVFLK